MGRPHLGTLRRLPTTEYLPEEAHVRPLRRHHIWCVAFKLQPVAPPTRPQGPNVRTTRDIPARAIERRQLPGRSWHPGDRRDISKALGFSLAQVPNRPPSPVRPRPRRSFTDGSIRIVRRAIGSAGVAGGTFGGDKSDGADAGGLLGSCFRAVIGPCACGAPTCFRAATSSDTLKRLARKNLLSLPRRSWAVSSAAGAKAPWRSSSSLVGTRRR